jgi:hypothetical protein
MSYVANAIPIGGARIADMASFGDLIKVLSREPKLFPHFGEARTAIFLVQEIEYDERFSATESAEARDRALAISDDRTTFKPVDVLSGSHAKSSRFAKEAVVMPEAIQQLGAAPGGIGAARLV